MNAVELKTILESHKEWLENTGGSRADLRGADLRNANLYGADLRNANLRGADLRRANLRDANLCGANLRGANLCYADLRDANLCYADLRDANLENVQANTYTSFYWLSCPETGEFTAFKKCRDGIIVTLLITADAKRSSATSRKCRASKAVVISIETKTGTQVDEAKSQHDSSFVYRVGETLEVSDFDNDRWNECSSGIHFFITRKEAEIY